ncbi:MAG: family 20 glycosylhydrolase [Bacteroidota bacterium]
MKNLITVALLVIFTGAATAQQTDPVNIIPKPLSVVMGSGAFTITKTSKIQARGAEAIKVAGMLNYFLKKKYGFELKVTPQIIANSIALNITSPALDKETYQLNVTSHGVKITGDKSGVFYGVQSLLQLINNAEDHLTIAAVTINDAPEFAYRGVMLDVARHFFTVDEVEKILDVMAYLKMNRLHWHLTDDQGWRLEIKKYPRLTAISAWRDSTIIGGYGDNKPFIYDGKKSGGYYTQAQAREVVKYAADRNIEVIPEIEMPGHSTAVLAAYPQLGNGAAQYRVPGFWGVHSTIYNPGEPTFNFLEDVLTEVMAIFPSKYIHIGGDEVPKTEWKASELAQRLIKENHLKDENELQSWFINRIEKFLNQHGRNLIGWDEILEGGLTPNATVMSWRGEGGGIQAAKEGHNVIMSPGGTMYLDHAQAKDGKTEPLAIGGFLPLSTVYGYDPRPKVLTTEQQKFITGVQSNLWTEYIPTANKLEYMLFPRVIAVAEVGWTKADHKDFADFSNKRLPAMLKDLDKFDINYRIPEADVLINDDPQTGRKKITIIPYVASAKIYYTIDGHKADNNAEIYSGPFLAPLAKDHPLTLKYVIVTAASRASNEFSLEIK